MAEMLFWFSIVLGIFTVGDLVAKFTKAKLSAVFITLLLFLILFVSKVLPADIIDKAGLTAASQWSVPILLFGTGTMLNLRQFIDEWRTVLTSWIGVIAVIIGVGITALFIGKDMALVSIPVINGALPATTIMTTAAMEKGLTLATIVFAMQKFVGTPFASHASLAEAKRLLTEYREHKANGTLELLTASQAKHDKPEAVKKETFAEKHEAYYTTNVCLFLAAAGGLLSVQLSKIIPINYSILGLVLGVLISFTGILPKNILEKAKTNGFVNMVVFAAIIPALAKISMADLVSLIIPVIVVFAVSIVSIFLFMKVLPCWKIIGSKSMAFGVGFCQMLGFPTTYLIANEVCEAVGETKEEKEYLMSKVMPRLVVGGLAAMVSIIVAGILAPMLG